jgi:hypothetical protein
MFERTMTLPEEMMEGSLELEKPLNPIDPVVNRSNSGVAESRYETVIVMLNEVARSEASGEILRSPW